VSVPILKHPHHFSSNKKNPTKSRALFNSTADAKLQRTVKAILPNLTPQGKKRNPCPNFRFKADGKPDDLPDEAPG